MAGLVVQSQLTVQTGSSATIAATFASPVTAGNTIRVCAIINAAQTMSVADGGDTFTSLDGPTTLGGIGSNQQWYSPNVAGGSSVTVTVTIGAATANCLLYVEEISGVKTATPIDGHTMTNQATPATSTDGVTISATNANQPAFVSAIAFVVFNTPSLAAGTGYTAGRSSATAIGAFLAESKRVTTAGSQAATFTIGAANSTNTMIAIFDEKVATGTRSRTNNGSREGSRQSQ